MSFDDDPFSRDDGPPAYEHAGLTRQVEGVRVISLVGMLGLAALIWLHPYRQSFFDFSIDVEVKLLMCFIALGFLAAQAYQAAARKRYRPTAEELELESKHKAKYAPKYIPKRALTRAEKVFSRAFSSGVSIFFSGALILFFGEMYDIISSGDGAFATLVPLAYFLCYLWLGFGLFSGVQAVTAAFSMPDQTLALYAEAPPATVYRPAPPKPRLAPRAAMSAKIWVCYLLGGALLILGLLGMLASAVYVLDSRTSTDLRVVSGPLLWVAASLATQAAGVLVALLGSKLSRAQSSRIDSPFFEAGHR